MRMRFEVTLDVIPQSYDGDTFNSINAGDVGEAITAALYKTYANPMRTDCGIERVVSIKQIDAS